MTINCTVKKSDIEDLVKVIETKLLGDKRIADYLSRVDESFKIADGQLLVEWVVREFKDESGRNCVDLDYIPFSTLLSLIEEGEYISVCQRLVKDCERVGFDSYYERSSCAFPIDFLIDKVNRLV